MTKTTLIDALESDAGQYWRTYFVIAALEAMPPERLAAIGGDAAVRVFRKALKEITDRAGERLVTWHVDHKAERTD